MITAKDLDTVLNVSAEAGYIDEQEKAMMASIMGFNDMQVKQVMVPRTSITAVDINWSEDRIIDVIMEAGYSRMPVFKDSLDNIVGIIYTKDMLSMIKNRGLIIFHDLIRVPYFIPETKNAGDLLKEFKKGKLHVAIVVDEFGGTAGLVSLEDILEEIVGEIHDEYDVDEKEIEDIGNGAYIVKGMIEISKVNDEPLKLEIPEDENINTMSGFLTGLFGYVPKPGETVKFGNFNFTVVRSDERKIMRIKIEPIPKDIVK
jgi:CBS domain containing-hemolysin-like protein